MRLDEMPVVTVPTDMNFAREMPRFLAHMAIKHGPIFKLNWIPQRQIVCLVGPEANKVVLHTHEAQCSHEIAYTVFIDELMGRNLINMDGAEAAHYRKLMAPAFSSTAISYDMPLVQRIIEAQTADWLARGEVDVCEEARIMTFAVAVGALFNVYDKERIEHLRELFHDVDEPGYDRSQESPELYEKRWQLHEELRAELRQLCSERRAAPATDRPEDVLDLLLHGATPRGRPLTDKQLHGHLRFTILAAHETTTALCSWLLYLLATHPEPLARVRVELDAALDVPPARLPALTLERIKSLRYLGYCLTEAGRLYPSVGYFLRGLTADLPFAGYTIPRGTLVMYPTAASHRLPTVFAEPDRFDPERLAPPRQEDKRTPYALATFGGGSRVCLGLNLGQTEIKAIAAYVLRHFEVEVVEGQDDLAMVYDLPEGTIPMGLRMRIRPRQMQSDPPGDFRVEDIPA